MLKISGAYSGEIAGIAERLNDSAKKLENYRVDDDTQGMLIHSFRAINLAASETVTCLLGLQHRLNDIMYGIKLGNGNE